MNMQFNKIRNRQYLSDLVDVLICFTSALLTYYIIDIQSYFERVGVFELTSIIYLFYFITVIVTNNGSTIGNNITKTSIINITSGEKSTLLLILRGILISSIILLIPNMFTNKLMYLVIPLLLLIPIRFKRNNYIIFSILNMTLKLAFISSDDIINNG